MKKIFLFCLMACMLACASASAQPASMKKLAKSVFLLKTFDEQGALLGSANGFYVDAQGEAVSVYQPFRGAARAVVIDADGKEHAVACIIGVNETYDVAKFRVEIKKTVPLQVASTTVEAGASLWRLDCRTKQKPVQGVVRKAERFASHYDYYTVAMPMSDEAIGSPLLTDDGRAAGLLQPSAQSADTLCYAVSALFADSLHMTGLGLNDPAMRAVKMPKDLPAELNQAILALYVAGSSLDSASYVDMMNRFVERFPQAPDGYQARAQWAVVHGDFAAAQRDMEQAIQQTEPKDAAHYNYARLIYQKELTNSQQPYEPWTLDLSLSEAQQAYAINPLPAYRHHQALVLFAQKKYDEATAVYRELENSTLRSADLFYEASKCREMAGDTLGQLAQLDSAVATFPRPLVRAAAPYLLVRAQVRLAAGRYREAVVDLNDYEALLPNQLSDQFYYLRHQAEIGGRLYQQALNDINQAISMRPDNDFYYAEKASLELRVGLLDDALETAGQLMKMAPNQSDGYLFLGLTQCLKGNKQDGLANLRKAEQMGDPQAKALIEKYQ